MTPRHPAPGNDHPEQRDPLERALADLTRWDDAPPELWRKALEQQPAPHPDTRSFRLLAYTRRPIFAAAAMILIVVIIGIVLLPQTESTPVASQAEPEFARRAADALVMAPAAPAADPDAAELGYQLSRRIPVQERSETAPPASARFRSRVSDATQDLAIARHIIRRTTLELHTADVRATFAQAILIPSAARGEYVQSSSLTGDGEHSRAELTLRIAADRLDDALNELRELGTVHTERSTGDDVTAQVVDLDAHLRNERRIESELLELLDQRDQAPLNDILQVRRSLGEVRQRIEHLTGQRENLSRMVSLATILVIIRPPPAEEEAPPSGAIQDYFSDTLARAWRAGTLHLADSTGVLITILIGGLIWWAPLAAGAGVLVHRRRKAIDRGQC